ncbi:uncharacterized protein LOC111136383 [Crassostrea virginica]
MECNYLPKSESTCLCLPIPGKSASGDNFSHGTVVRVLGLVVLLLSLAVLYLFLQIHQLNRTLDSLHVQGASSQVQNNENFRWNLKKSLEEDAHNSDRNIGVDRVKRNGRWRIQIRNEVSEMKRQIDEIVNITIPNLQAGIMKKVVHLEMSSSMTQNILQLPVNSIVGCHNKQCLRWADPESTYSSTFDYMKDNAYDMVVAVKVRSPGLYFLYSQLAINGPRQGADPSVGFETVLVRGNTEKILIKSYITQDNRGGEYGGFAINVSPFDTINQMGTFKLLCDDYVFIRPIGNPALVFSNTQASYFGVSQINPARALLNGNHGCNARD